MSLFLCSPCFNGEHLHEEADCKNMWLDSECQCSSIRTFPIRNVMKDMHLALYEALLTLQGLVPDNHPTLLQLEEAIQLYENLDAKKTGRDIRRK